MLHRGGCHCGQVQFEFTADPNVVLHRCNCTICKLTGFLHLIIPGGAFNLLTEWDDLGLYQFNSRTAKHYFCRRCGIKSFYVPRSNPDGFSVNFRCVDEENFDDVRIEDFDGANREQHASELRHLSDPDRFPSG